MKMSTIYNSIHLTYHNRFTNTINPTHHRDYAYGMGQYYRLKVIMYPSKITTIAVWVLSFRSKGLAV